MRLSVLKNFDPNLRFKMVYVLTEVLTFFIRRVTSMQTPVLRNCISQFICDPVNVRPLIKNSWWFFSHYFFGIPWHGGFNGGKDYFKHNPLWLSSDVWNGFFITKQNSHTSCTLMYIVYNTYIVQGGVTSCTWSVYDLEIKGLFEGTCPHIAVFVICWHWTAWCL